MERNEITSPRTAAELLADMGLLEKEHMRVILLDSRNHVKDIVEVYKGAVNTSQVKIGEVFRPAVQQLASAIIAAHNHPSTDVSPSPDDVAVTRALVQAGQLLDIQLLDHLILGHGGKWCSLKEKGMGF